jgi:hypothetical protein
MIDEPETLLLPCAYRLGDELGFSWVWFLGKQKILRVGGGVGGRCVGNWRLTKDKIRTLIQFLERGLEDE